MCGGGGGGVPSTLPTQLNRLLLTIDTLTQLLHIILLHFAHLFPLLLAKNYIYLLVGHIPPDLRPLYDIICTVHLRSCSPYLIHLSFCKQNLFYDVVAHCFLMQWVVNGTAAL